MFNRLQQAFGRATKLTRSGKVLSAALVLQKLVTDTAQPVQTKPVRKRAATKPLKTATAQRKAAPLPKPKTKPRAGPGQTARRTTADGARQGSFTRAVFSDDQGRRSYKLYIPAHATPGALMPLVVMLHGCTQTPDDFATGTGMNLLADERGFMVAYPAQPVSANRNRCWNWFRPTDQARDRGEPALIAGIARQILRDHPADPRRVYIAGLSAGGAAAAIAANAYPDIFAAAGVHSGLPIGAAQGPASAFLAMQAGSLGSHQSVAMPTIIFHGDADQTVHPRNGRAVAARALGSFPRLTETVRNSSSKGGHKFSKTAHRAQNRKSYCEYWTVAGAGHAWSGGKATGTFADPKGPDASREMVRFFLQHRI
jgi:poly(hydroxyalkanoate) depolymerase family esterase